MFTKGITPSVGKVLKYSAIPKFNESSMLTALQAGPVSVSIATNSNFMLYRYVKTTASCNIHQSEADTNLFVDISSGIFSDDTCKNGTIAHGVVIVGQNVVNGTDYWIVRNSWGTSWGQKGYVYMKRNVNICRISEYAFIATLWFKHQTFNLIYLFWNILLTSVFLNTKLHKQQSYIILDYNLTQRIYTLSVWNSVWFNRLIICSKISRMPRSTWTVRCEAA